jgi:glycogen phosphorylase
MRPTHRFRVEPSIPASLAALPAIARNLRWTWDHPTRQMFANLDATSWAASGNDPVRQLELIPDDRWAELANDHGLAERVVDAKAQLDAALGEPRWFQGRQSPLSLIAYFSPEFGLSETLAQYSGGLGILAGDHLKAASDLGVPLVAVGLLYRQGYFRQRLRADGWQDERFPPQDPNGLAMVPTGVQVSVEVGGENVSVAIWRVDVGRVPLYLLDTAQPGNSDEAVAITDRLYGGDEQHRLRQEIILGIGGVRALRALGLQPQVFHTNEGHAGFLSLERIREQIVAGLSWAEAIEATRAGGLFTTHTPVPAGIDRFPDDLLVKYFTSFAAQCGVTLDDIRALGRRPDEGNETRFNMAVMGLKLSARSNGVAALHGDVSRAMFQGMWPSIPVDEVPIGSVTNGVHAHTWIAPEITDLFSTGIHPMWDGADAATWDGANKLDNNTIWSVRNTGRSKLVRFVRDRMGDDLLDPDALTIGFARRFATYKRATLLLSQPERLAAMLTSTDRPVQFVFAGKAHPADQPGKEMIQGIDQFSRSFGGHGRLVFVQDYDMAVARMMYHGADVWLNNPRRPQEACGTSGMKAALNGALNLSILDGWWDEAYDGRNGWAIDSAENELDLGRRDAIEAASLFRLLEDEIVPLFYDRHDGVPHGWLDMVKHGWASIGPVFTAARMVKDYTTEFYEPAAASATRLNANASTGAKQFAVWKQRVRQAWSAVAVHSTEYVDGGVRAHVGLGGLTAADVAVEVVHGPLDADGEFISSTVGAMAVVETRADGTAVYGGLFDPTTAGAYGSTVRVLPHHPEMATSAELGIAVWS